MLRHHNYTAWVKKQPLKLLCDISVMVNLYNWKFVNAQTYSYVYTNFGAFILYELYHFYWWDPSNFNNSIQFTKFVIFFVKMKHIKWHLIKYNSQYRLYELSHYMFKLSTVGWHTWLHSLAVVIHSVVNGFLWYKADQIKWSAPLNAGTVFCCSCSL